VVLIAGFVGVAVWHFTTASFELLPELRPLAAAYGPERTSQYHEEWIIRDFFQDKRGGFFVDVGANHYRTHSNTYYLEHALGWSGIAVEPLAAFEPEYRQHRPATRFRPFFVSDVSNAEAKLYLLEENHLVTSSDKSFTERFGAGARELRVPTITLTHLLESERVERIDFMSMDIELHEPKALAGFDIDRFRPSLVCIEAHPEVRQNIIDYFTRHHYVVVGKYLRADEHNLYFAPLESTSDR
jgi:FkbM family methyltransferase